MVVSSCTLSADVLETCLIVLIGLRRGAKWRIAHVQGIVTTTFDLVSGLVLCMWWDEEIEALGCFRSNKL